MLLYEGDKKEALKSGLRQINKGLPSNVYIPFTNSQWRNYTVLNICDGESKLFLTNKRAPFLVCLEIYRPEEILITSQNRYREMLGHPVVPASASGGLISAGISTELPITERFVDVVAGRPISGSLANYNPNALHSMINSQSQQAAELRRALEKLNKNLDKQISQDQSIKTTLGSNTLLLYPLLNAEARARRPVSELNSQDAQTSDNNCTSSAHFDFKSADESSRPLHSEDSPHSKYSSRRAKSHH